MRIILSMLLSSLIFTMSQAQTKNLSCFTSLSTSGNVQVTLKRADQCKADYKVTKGTEDDLVLEVKNEVLTIKIKSKISGLWNQSSTKAQVTVYYRNLTDIDCSAGSGISSIEEIVTEKMDIDASSGASCQIKLKSNLLSVNTSSGSSVKITGYAQNASYDVSSGAKIEAGNMITEKVDANVSSGGSISLHASKSLKADASSGGSIKYKGNPVNKNIDSGMSGSISAY
ncbi:MAG: DUF2807 domain-containing protein [Saprospiraceae bacterium]|nr:DUF2807 domain-containing protein [Saprospiraceae bacterium]